jgi:hypothetical protein
MSSREHLFGLCAAKTQAVYDLIAAVVRAADKIEEKNYKA